MTNCRASKKSKLRHAEYYDFQDIQDKLYADSKAGKEFKHLIELITLPQNIKLAYRNLKKNRGSRTAGTDKRTIENLAKLSEEKLIQLVQRKFVWYVPQAVRRVEIPKGDGKMRPLGIPTILDRLIQQCILQVLMPICEAKFHDHSYGFRPNRSQEHAMAQVMKNMQCTNLHFVVDVDIKRFFENVNHGKLLKQIWAMGIRDKKLISIISVMLKAEIAEIGFPEKGTPQGGIISPLLSNVVLNIVRYADDFRILCRTKSEAERIRIAVSKWLWERLRLEVSPEKTRIVNVKKKYSEFLGFKIKVHPKGRKWTVESHVCDKALCRQKEALIEQAKKVAKPPQHSTESYEIHLYNAKVVGAQSYYKIATHINLDFNGLNLAVMRVFTNRLRTQKCNRLRRKGRPLTKAEIGLYGNTPMMRYVAGSDEPIYPIGFVQHKPPWTKKRKANLYTAEGRKEIHDNLRINTSLMVQMMKSSGKNSTEYSDNRISLYSAQWGKCGITGIEFQCLEDIHCHHKLPKQYGGTDRYDNLVLLLPQVHRLIHAADEITIRKYLELLKLDKTQILKLNKYRELAKNNPITVK